jgi:nitrogen fixation protein NifU and related proteins
MPGLEDLYREVILDHYRSPRNKGQLESPPATRAEGFNPLCGDEIVVYLMMDGDIVADVKIGGQGCSISQASASMMSAAIKGKTLDEARGLIVSFEELMGIKEAHDHSDSGEPPVRLGDLAALTGVKKFPVRIKCATLAWYTLVDALNQVSPTT